MAGRLPFGDTGPAVAIVPVTPSDSVDITLTRGLLVTEAGTATIVDGTGTQRASVPLQAGYNPLAVKRIFLTGLTATGIFALY